MLSITRVEGPHKGRGGRMFVRVHYADGRRVTHTYARYIMMVTLGRELRPNEAVHHINGNHQDDRYENLALTTRSGHIRQHHADTIETARASYAASRPSFTHGTLYAWMKMKCDCDECLAAKRDWNDARNAARRTGESRGHYRRTAPVANPRQDAPEGMAWCSSCQDYRPVGEFTENRKSTNGLDAWCRKCKSENRRRSREARRVAGE